MPPGRPRRSEVNRILGEANVSGEYQPLRYAFADILNGSVNATAAVQQQVAFEVNQIYKGAYKAYQGRGGGGTFEDYMHTPGVQWDLRSQPMDLSMLASTPTARGSSETFGQKYTGLSAIKNVEDANSWLASTMLPGVLNEAAQMEEEGRGAMDYVSAGVIGMMEAMPSYVPGKSNPSLFLARAAYNGIRDAARSDRLDLSIDASPNSFYEGEQFLGNPGMEPSPLLPGDARAALDSQMQGSHQWFGAYTPTDINPQSPAGLVGVRAGDAATNLGFIYSNDPNARQMTYDALDVLSSGGTLRLQGQRGGIDYNVPIQGGLPSRLMQPEAAIPFYERIAQNMGESALPSNYYVDSVYGQAGPGGSLMSNGVPNPSLATRPLSGSYVQAWITAEDVRTIGSQIAAGVDYTSGQAIMARRAMNTIPGMFRASSGIMPGEDASAIEMYDDYAGGMVRILNNGGAGGRAGGSSYDYLAPYRFTGGPGGNGASQPWLPGGTMPRPTLVNDPNQNIGGLAAPDTQAEADNWRDVTNSSPRSLMAQQNSAYALALSLVPNASGYGSLGTRLGGLARQGFTNYNLADFIPNRQVESDEFGMAVTGAGGDQSLMARRRWMQATLNQIGGRSPALAARARYVGFGAGKIVDGVNLDEQFGQNVDALAEQYDLSLSYDPKHPDAFGRQFEALRGSDPQMAGMLSEVLGMPNEEAVYNSAKKLQRKLGLSGAENSRSNTDNYNVAARTGRSGVDQMGALLNGTGTFDPDTGQMITTVPGINDSYAPSVAARSGGGEAAARRAAARAAERANAAGGPPTSEDWDNYSAGNEEDPFGADWGEPNRGA
ncbi:MAG: sigma factor, partial [Anaerolineaceae bacterium]